MDEIFGLSGIFNKISEYEQSGSLKVEQSDKEAYIYFKQGQVKCAAYPHKRSVLAEGLLRCSRFSKDVLENIFAEQVKKKKSLVTTIQEANIDAKLKDMSFILEVCRNQIAEEVYDILSWPDVHCQFSENKIEGVFDPELLELPINLNPGALSMEGARRQDEWSIIRQQIESNKDVPYLVGSKENFDKIKESLKKSLEGASMDVLDELLGAINGIRDFDEILEVVRLSSFQSIKLLAKLKEDKYICVKSAEELKNLANLEILQQNLKKCIRLYERAEELGLKNFETIRWLSRAYENSDLTNKAVEKYRELGQAAMEANNYEEAIRAYDKVVKFAPEDLESHEKLKNSYIKRGKLDKAAEVSAIYARKVAVLDKRRAIAILDEANRNYPSSHSNLELMASLYQQMGDAQNAILTYNILANLMKKQDNLQGALDAYRKILAMAPGNTKAHLEIAKGLIEAGQIDEGVQEYKKLGQLLINRIIIRSPGDMESIDAACDLLIQICESMIQFEPNNIIAREWLVDACLIQKDEKNALNILRELLGLLQNEQNLEGLVKNLRKIVKMDPEDFQSRKRLADTLLRLEKPKEAIAEYTDLGNFSYEKNDMRRSREAFESIITIDPFHLYARHKRAEILCHLNLHARAMEEYKLVGYLSKAIEKFPEAIDAFSKMVHLSPDKEIWGAVEVAKLCETLNEGPKAVEYYLKYAQNQRAKGNYGEAHMACSHILSISPEHKEATTIKEEAESKFAEVQPFLQKYAPKA